MGVLSSSDFEGSWAFSYAGTIRPECVMGATCPSAFAALFGAAVAARFFLRQNTNRKPASSRATIGMATPIPAFAPVDRPVSTTGSMLALGEGDVVVVKVARVDDRMLEPTAKD